MPPENKKNNSIVDDLMPKEAFERRFAFIDNDTLKKNIAITFEYIVFLIETASKESHKKLIKSSLYKDALVYTGTVVEACLTHVLLKYLSANKLQKSKVLSPKWKEEAQGVIYSFSKKRRIRYVIEHLAYEAIRSSSNLIEINRACLRGHILNKKEYKVAIEFFGEPSEEVSDWAYAVSMGAIASSLDNEQIRNNLEEFIAFLEAEIAKKERRR